MTTTTTTASDQPRNFLWVDQHGQDDNGNQEQARRHGGRILLLNGIILCIG